MATNRTLRRVVDIAYQLNFYISEQSNPHRDVFNSLLQSQISFVIERHAEPPLPVSFPYPVDWALESQRPLRKAVNEFTRLASRLPSDLEGFPASTNATPTPAGQPTSQQIYHQGHSHQIPPQTFNATTQTILFGGYESVAIDSIEVIKSIRVDKTKAIFEVLWHGQPAVAKCWTPSEFQRFGLTKVFYLLLKANIMINF